MRGEPGWGPIQSAAAHGPSGASRLAGSRVRTLGTLPDLDLTKNSAYRNFPIDGVTATRFPTGNPTDRPCPLLSQTLNPSWPPIANSTFLPSD